jgi:hypothetical protein
VNASARFIGAGRVYGGDTCRACPSSSATQSREGLAQAHYHLSRIKPTYGREDRRVPHRARCLPERRRARRGAGDRPVASRAAARAADSVSAYRARLQPVPVACRGDRVRESILRNYPYVLAGSACVGLAAANGVRGHGLATVVLALVAAAACACAATARAPPAPTPSRHAMARERARLLRLPSHRGPRDELVRSALC